MIHIPIQEILLISPSQRFAEMKTYQLIRYFQFVLNLFAAVFVFKKKIFKKQLNIMHCYGKSKSETIFLAIGR